MLQELLDSPSRIKSFEIYVNDKLVDEKIGHDYVEDVEIEANFFRHSIMATFVCFEELFTLTVGQNPSAVNDKTTIRLIITDRQESHFDRRFVVLKTERLDQQNSKRSTQWRVYLEDIFGNALNSANFTRYITEAGFSGTPLEVVTKAVETLFRLPMEVGTKLGDPELFITSERNELDFIHDDNPPITHRFSKDLTPIENIKKLAKRYNIHLFQDFYTFYIIQNLTFENAPKPESPVFIEACNGKKYLFKICDKIKNTPTMSVNDRANFRVSLNLGGKKQVLKELNFSDIARIINLNGNEDEFKETPCNNTIEVSSGYVLTATLLNDAFKRYITASNVVIYTRPKIEDVAPGNITSVDLRCDSEFASKRLVGDYRFSGNWLIRSCTLKLIRQEFLLCRLILCRFDNQEDFANLEQPGVLTNDQKVQTATPDMPENRKEFLAKYDDDTKTQESSALEKIKKLGNTPFASDINNAVQNALKLSANVDAAFESLGSFISLVKKLEKYKTVVKIALIVLMPNQPNIISDSFDKAISSLNERLSPCYEAIEKCFNTLTEYCNRIEEVFNKIIATVEDKIEEARSRIISAIYKYSSIIKSSINGMLGEINSTISMYVSQMSKYVKQFVDDFTTAIGDGLDEEFEMEKTRVGTGEIKRVIKLAIDSLVIEPAVSLIEDQVLGVLNNLVNPSQIIDDTIEKILGIVSNSNILSKVSTIAEEAEKYKTTIEKGKRSISELREKRDSILRGLRK